MIAEIISVGTELLLGDILNTNAKYIASELSQIGINVYYQSVVGDNFDRLYKALKTAFSRCDVVITTGGLGPTEDDITKEVASAFFNMEMVLHKESMNHIEDYFNNRNMKISENNYRQGYFPKDSVVIPNENGTAPGCLINKDDKMLFLLPGPPKELVPMFKSYVLPRLLKNSSSIFYTNVIKFADIGESSIETVLKDIIHNQNNPSLALYAEDYIVKLRITGKAKNVSEGEEIVLPIKNKVYDLLGDKIFGEDDDTLESVVIKKLIESKMTIAVAESCTGGLVSSRLVNVSGSSKVFLEGVVTYSNESKIKRLNVKEETLNEYGAVSKEVAMEMAIGVAKSLDTNIGLSTTGVAGPTGGTKEKPLGLVYVGLFMDGKVSYIELKLDGTRENIRNRSTMLALNYLRTNIR